MKNDKTLDYDVAQIDRFAWQAITGWHVAADFDPVHDGLNLGELVRKPLWGRVGRAIRAALDPQGFRFEKDLFFHFDRHRPPRRRDTAYRFLQHLMSSVRAFGRGNVSTPLVRGNPHFGGPPVLVPHPSARMEQVAAVLLSRGYPLVVAPACVLAGFSQASRCPTIHLAKPDHALADQLHKAVVEGLTTLGVRLQSFDVKSLRSELRIMLARIRKAAAEIDLLAPRALLLHGDNHSPYQEYVAVANRRGIPTITFQHGLDCERYYLDDAYCTHMGVWGEQRKRRYENDSGRQLERLQVTGNPAFDAITSLPDRIANQGEYALWITRPHTSSFCYSPSRRVTEGLDIFEVLLSAVARSPEMRLVVKPHPQDYPFLYEKRIAEHNLTDRVKVVMDNLPSLLGKADIVISEDTTGGLEAMLKGKILIHSHFAVSEPVLPFVNYGAALSGFSPETLLESLARAYRLSVSERDEMLAGQRSFVKEFAGELDGRAGERQISFMTSIFDKEHK